MRISTPSYDRPYGIRATAGADSITLTWQDPDTHPTYGYYQVLRHRPELGEDAPLVYEQYVATSDRTYTDSSVEPGVMYVYSVKAVKDPFGYMGPASASVEVRMPPDEGRQDPPANSPAGGVPTISGIVQVGATLTADTSGISDSDGLTNATYSYQWVANDTTTAVDIGDATESTYTLSDGDAGKTVQVRVSFTDDENNDETLTSEATVAVESALPLTASIHDEPQSHDGENAFTFELRFSDEFSISYRTLRDHAFTVTGGRVESTRRLERNSEEPNRRWEITVSVDSGGDVIVVLPITTDCDDQGAICTAGGRMLSNRIELTVSGPEPVNAPAIGQPTISGTPRVGETLTVDTSGITDANGLTNAAFSYQWKRSDGISDVEIPNATSTTYLITTDDVGKTIKVRATFTDNARNEESLTSDATAAVAATVPGVPRSVAIERGGTGELDVTWEAPGSNGGSDITGYTVQWKEAADNWDTPADVSSATTTTTSYTISRLELGTEYSVRVVATSSVGDGPPSTEVRETADGQTSQQRANTPATGAPTIGGTVQVGQMLTVDTSGIDDDDGLNDVTFSYQWIRSDGTTETYIQNATSTTYTLVSLDEGKTIKVRVSFSDEKDNEESLTSAATMGVAPQSDTTAPTISSVRITSDPDENDADLGAYAIGRSGSSIVQATNWASGVYRIGDDIQMTVSFSENITVTGSPQLELVIGSNNRTAAYESSTTTEVVFRYTVAAGDSDTDGISIGANKIALNGGSIKDAGDNAADLTHASVAAQDGHSVDGIRPSLKGLYFVASSDGSDGAYSAGDTLIVRAEFTEGPIRGSVSGPPQVKLDFDGEEKGASWDNSLRFNDIRPHVSYFGYVVQPGDLDNDGPSIKAKAVALNGGFIRDTAGNDAVLTNSAVTANSYFIVDAVAPTVSSIAITSDPGDDDTYGTGDKIEVTVTFSEDVEVASSFSIAVNGETRVYRPQVELDIGGRAKSAYFQSVRGPEVTFAYAVQSGDTDADGISIDANKIVEAFEPNTGFSAIRDSGWNGADLTHKALADNPSHKVVGS